MGGGGSEKGGEGGEGVLYGLPPGALANHHGRFAHTSCCPHTLLHISTQPPHACTPTGKVQAEVTTPTKKAEKRGRRKQATARPPTPPPAEEEEEEASALPQGAGDVQGSGGGAGREPSVPQAVLQALMDEIAMEPEDQVQRHPLREMCMGKCPSRGAGQMALPRCPLPPLACS